MLLKTKSCLSTKRILLISCSRFNCCLVYWMSLLNSPCVISLLVGFRFLNPNGILHRQQSPKNPSVPPSRKPWNISITSRVQAAHGMPSKSACKFGIRCDVVELETGLLMWLKMSTASHMHDDSSSRQRVYSNRGPANYFAWCKTV